MKRIVSLLLAMVLVVSLLPMAALATGEEGTGTQEQTGNPPTTDTTDNTGTTGGTGTSPDTTTTGGSGTTPDTTLTATPAPQTVGNVRSARSTGSDEADEEKKISFSGAKFEDKTYNGTTIVDIPKSIKNELPEGADFNLSATVADANVGEGKAVTVKLTATSGGEYSGDYWLADTDGLKVNIVQAKIKETSSESGTVTIDADSLTLYRNVQRSYGLDLFKNLNLGDGCSLGTTTVTLDADSSGTLYKGTSEEEDAKATATFSLDGDDRTLTITSDFDHVSSDKGYLIFKVESQNYQTFSIKVPITVADLTHTVKFDANIPEGDPNQLVSTEKTMADISLKHNVTGTKLTQNVFERNNYTFKGWNTAKDGKGTSYDDEAEIVENTAIEQKEIILYAQWEPTTKNRPEEPDAADLLGETKANIYAEDDANPTSSVELADCNPTVTISGNDAEGYTATMTFGKKFWDDMQPTLSKDLCDAFAEGENRKGGSWYPESTEDYPIPQTLTYTYSPSDSNVGGLTSGSGDDSHSSSWTASDGNKPIGIRMYQHFTVTYTMDAATAPSSAGGTQTNTVKKGADLPGYNGKTSGIEGHTFLGWYIGSDKVDSLPETVTQDYSFTGKWRKNTFTIQFESGATDATGTTASMTVTWGDPDAKLPQCGFQRSGYRFTGWMQQGNPEAVTCPAGTSAGKLGSSDKERITMVAQWEKAVDHVDFSLSGYDITKFVTQIKVTTDTKNVHIYKYNSGEEVFWISCDDEDITSDTVTFGADKIYYLYVMFNLDQGYADGGLSTSNVLLDGKNAKSLKAPDDNTPGYIAEFQLPVIRKITVKAMTKNGTIDPGKDFYAKDGEKVIFKVTPSTGYRCSTFKLDGKAQQLTKNTYELDVRKSHTVKVWFAKDSGNAKTGDDLRLIYLAAAGAISLAALAALAVVGIKKKKKK